MISIDGCIADALRKLEPMPYNKRVLDVECEIYVWPQTWEDTSCGQGGVAGQMMTSAPTVVIVGPNSDACVYHGGNLAYHIDRVNENFWQAIDNRHLPGKMDGREREKLRASKEQTNVEIYRKVLQRRRAE